MSLDGYHRNSDAAQVDAWQIIEDCAKEYGCHPRDVLGRIRYTPYVKARHKAMYEIARRMPWMSFPKIGQFVGNRDHSTVQSACNKLGLPKRFKMQRFSSRYDFLFTVRAVDTLFFGIGAAVHFEAVQCSKGEQNETT